jgi:hypothetical protein
MTDDIAPFRLAYEASLHAIQDQATVIESLRSRAGTIFAATALVTSFLGGSAFRDEATRDALSGWSPSALAIGLFVLLAILTLAILWPFRFRFSVSAIEMLGIVEGRESGNAVDAREAHRELAIRYETMYDANARWIRGLFWCFRAAIVCLVGEVATWILVLERAA